MNKENELTPEEKLALANYLRNAEEIVCKCGNTTFQESVKLKKVSKLITGQKDDSIFTFPALVCSKCGEELIPIEEKKENNIIEIK